MDGYQTRTNMAPPNAELQNYLSESTFERMLESNILESISTRDNTDDNFVAQIFTTRSTHNFVEGDLIQISLHYQESHNYAYSPKSRNGASNLPFGGMIHAHLLEVVNPSGKTFEANRISYIQNITKDDNNKMVVAIRLYSFYYMTFHIALGQMVNIECYECGVEGLDGKLTNSNG